MDEIRKDCTKIADVFLPFIMQKWYTFQELRQSGLAKISFEILRQGISAQDFTACMSKQKAGTIVDDVKTVMHPL